MVWNGLAYINLVFKHSFFFCVCVGESSDRAKFLHVGSPERMSSLKTPNAHSPPLFLPIPQVEECTSLVLREKLEQSICFCEYLLLLLQYLQALNEVS